MGRVVGWCVAGLAGAAIGWLARGAFPAARTDPAGVPGPADAAGTAGGPGLAAGREPAPAPARAAGDAPASATAPGAPPTAAPPPERTVDEWLAELRAAPVSGETERFRRAVRGLGEADDPRGDAALVAVMADLATPLPVIGDELATALANSRAEGIATAARARIAAAIERDESGWHHYKGWVDLVARHGTAADLEWLGGDALRDRDSWALQALGRSGKPEAVEVLRRRAEAGGAYELQAAIGELAKTRPDEAWAVVGAWPERGTLAAFAGAAPPEALGRVEEHLRTLSDDESRIEGVYVVSALANRKHDVSGLAVVTEAPVRFLARIAAGEPVTERTRPLLNKAGYAIEYNRLVWSEHAARTLEAADVALDAAGISVGGPDFPHVARLVREGLKNPWK